ncbi:uncharacterized protein FOMMEDRAFT_160917 [Fomitiporia mediterranea MF3/22]|uniref:uncharacterized protein n=1 Tax=Fomitiporia mediterranea (strain MF3/22) TaxID=694068 RepID=UPI0004408E93|nr:uncharacterized protein FOMMEDRAFT_160917 [Fomitiporia mediterranea MF3/22]EJC99312.1 hypothetical protein FOMMEDRAFT_160917 [Fomitiporia mediterranea MF3/22]
MNSQSSLAPVVLVERLVVDGVNCESTVADGVDDGRKETRKGRDRADGRRYGGSGADPSLFFSPAPSPPNNPPHHISGHRAQRAASKSRRVERAQTARGYPFQEIRRHDVASTRPEDPCTVIHGLDSSKYPVIAFRGHKFPAAFRLHFSSYQRLSRVERF